MAVRKALSKKIRFEVLKRDKFTCQYCGRMSPDVLLEVDHIQPVAEGGSNDLLNLITSCQDCNRGKGKRRIEDDSEIKKQQKALKDLAFRKEQMEMMLEWRKELSSLEEKQVDAIEELLKKYLPDRYFNDSGRIHIKQLLREYGFSEVYESFNISFNKYYKPDEEYSIQYAFDKVGGVCYNRKNNRKADYYR